jgi:acyl-CoA thioester hydrolase
VYYDDEVLVRTWLKKVRESVIIFHYELVRLSDGTLLAEGRTAHVVTNSKMKTAPLPEKYLNVFRNALDSAATARGID